ncbi:MAG: hypothetical protein M3069_15355 [Chloroflexota bacterium]|nr:hypothetical protein [Chloroflexota bacterium]
MTMLSPAATYHAELRQELGSVGRALALQRALVWAARGLAAGTIVVLGVVIWAWIRGAIAALPVALLVATPIVAGLATGLASLSIRHKADELARRVDRAARLSERSTTALELGARGVEFPLALAQMRDAVEHLKRVDLLEAFPLRFPKNELITAFLLVVIAAIIGLSPNPWLLRARASNPAISIAREQAQRVQRLADSIQPQGSPDLEALRALVSKGARSIDTQSNQPDAALAALQDLEDQVRQMSAGDDQLASALAAIASALASDPATQPLANAINTGDMRQISQASKDLAQAAASLSGQDQQRVAKVLRDAAGQAGRSSQNVAGQLSAAAEALQNAAGSGTASSAAAGDQSQTGGRAGQPQPSGAGAQSGNAAAASDALNQLGNDAAAADERARTASQLESSRNALERALGRSQSRAGSASSGNRSSSSSNPQSSQAPNSGQTGDSSQASSGGQSQAGDGTGSSNAGSPGGGDPANSGNNGQGGGYSTGGQDQTKAAASGSRLDTVTTPQQVSSNSPFTPDQSSANPYLGDAGSGNAQAAQEPVQPAFSNKSTQGNDSSSIPLGLRDLVKDYFSSLDKKSP